MDQTLLQATAAVGNSIRTTNTLSSYARDEIDRGTLDISAKDTGKDLDAKSSNSSSKSGSNSGMGNLIGSVAGITTQTALDKSGVLSGLPGASGIAARGVGDVVSGKSPEQVGLSAAVSGVQQVAARGLQVLGMPSIGIAPAIGIGTSIAMEAQKANPNYGAAALKSGLPAVASAIGGALLGTLGAYAAGTLASMATQSSLANGSLGDATDSRSRENLRDSLEDVYTKFGVNYFSALDASAAVANDPSERGQPTAGQLGIGNPGSYGGSNTNASMHGDSTAPDQQSTGQLGIGNPGSHGGSNTNQGMYGHDPTGGHSYGSGDGGSSADSTGAGGDAGVGGAQDSGDHY